KMKYAAHNALGILKNSVGYVIVCRLVAQRQRMIGAKLRFRTWGRRHSWNNRYKLTPRTSASMSCDRVACPKLPALGVVCRASAKTTPFAWGSGRATPDYFSACNRSIAILASETTRGA